MYGAGQETRRRLGHPMTLFWASDAMYEIPWNYLHGWNGNRKIEGNSSTEKILWKEKGTCLSETIEAF
jgi:hypothetical protein